MFETMAIMLGAALATPAPAPAVAQLAWMSGRWEAESDQGWTEEQWSAPRGGVMMGFSRSGAGDGLREYEFIRLAPGESGVPTYFASPGGRAPVGFALVRSEGSSATFENPAHDFPQRVHYRRDGDTMVATISAIDGSNAISWTYRRRP